MKITREKLVELLHDNFKAGGFNYPFETIPTEDMKITLYPGTEFDLPIRLKVPLPETVVHQLENLKFRHFNNYEIICTYGRWMTSVNAITWVDEHQEQFVNAVVNGWEVSDKKYNVSVIGLEDSFYWKTALGNLSRAGKAGNGDQNQQFTLNEIEKYGLTDCPRKEVEADDI